MPRSVFHPMSLSALKGYTRKQLLADLIAGLTVGFVALPLALALGIGSIDKDAADAAGISPPIAGLVTAIVAGFIISALGGTRTSIGGPSAAFIVIVASIAHKHGYDGLAIASIMAGLLLIALGVSKLGGMIKYIPYPVTTGLTTGIGVTIFTGQIKDLLGLHTAAPGDAPIPPEFIGKIQWYATHAGTIRWPTAIVGIVSVAVVFLWPKLVTRRVPAPLVVMVAATLIAQLFHVPLENVGDRFGALPTFIPMPRLPHFDLSQVRDLVGPAMTIAMLVSIESLLCGVVADGMLGTRHRSNTELIAQGIANVASPLFGGIPATGAITRTATNIQSGGRTPIAGMVHAITLLAVLLLIGKYAALVPLCVLSSMLVVVAYRISELDRFWWLLKGPRHDAMVLLSTFVLTVFTDLTIAVGVGVVFAAMLFMKRMADLANVGVLNGESTDIRREVPDEQGRAGNKPPKGIEVYDVSGPFFFGAAYKLRDTLDAIGEPPKVLIINMPNVLAVDATGLYALHELKKRCTKDGTRLLLAGIHAQPVAELVRSGLLDIFGDENLVGTLPEALQRAREILGTDPMMTHTMATAQRSKN